MSGRPILLWALPQTSPEPEESLCSKDGRVERAGERDTSTSSAIPALQKHPEQYPLGTAQTSSFLCTEVGDRAA